MKNIIMSIKPVYANKIFSEEKKYEFRKSIPKNKFEKVFVYSSSPKKKVIGCFSIGKIHEFINIEDLINTLNNEEFGIEIDSLRKYFENSEKMFAISIENVVKYEKELDLVDFGINTAPQNYCYIKEEFNEREI